MVETVDFSKGNVTQEQIKCRYPNCNKDGLIPMFEDIIDLKKVIPYCYEHSIIIRKEREQKKIREEIIKMKEEGII